MNEKIEQIAWSWPLFCVLFGNKKPQSGCILGASRLKHCLCLKPVWQKIAAYILMHGQQVPPLPGMLKGEYKKESLTVDSDKERCTE